jgi:hypothetical protein
MQTEKLCIIIGVAEKGLAKKLSKNKNYNKTKILYSLNFFRNKKRKTITGFFVLLINKDFKNENEKESG